MSELLERQLHVAEVNAAVRDDVGNAGEHRRAHEAEKGVKHLIRHLGRGVSCILGVARIRLGLDTVVFIRVIRLAVSTGIKRILIRLGVLLDLLDDSEVAF